MKRIRISKHDQPDKWRLEPLPLDPRDLDIIRAKQLRKPPRPSRRQRARLQPEEMWFAWIDQLVLGTGGGRIRETWMASERTIRVTHHEREDAIEGLQDAYALGCLDDCELEERTSLAYAAKTRGELADLVGDLPAVQPEEMPVMQGRPRSGWAHHSLSWSCWLMLGAAGAWLITVAATGVVTAALIFTWLLVLRVCGLLFGRLDPGGLPPPRV